MSFFILGALSAVTFSFLDSLDKSIDLQIKEAKDKNMPIPSKNPKIGIGMNITNKITGFAFPWCVGNGTCLELVSMTSTPIGLGLGIASAVFLSGSFYAIDVFARDYEKNTEILKNIK